jgi:hypothetical protein
MTGMDSCCATCARLLAVSHLLLDPCNLPLSLRFISKLVLLLLGPLRPVFWLLSSPFALFVQIFPLLCDSIISALAVFYCILVSVVFFSLVQSLLRHIHDFDGDCSVAIFVNVLGLVVYFGGFRNAVP